MPGDVRRSEVYWVDWSLGRGSEQSGLRPALIVQNDIGNRFSPTTIVAAFTTSADRSYPFMVVVTAGESGLPKDGAVDLAQILTIDKSRLGEKCGKLNEARMAEVDEAIKTSLGID